MAGTAAVITDTRKTTPGLRELEKYAVRCGGACNHRYNLGEALLVKDNHVCVAASYEAELPADWADDSAAVVVSGDVVGCAAKTDDFHLFG